MSKKTKFKPSVQLKLGANIGASAAEQDAEFLENCFIDIPALESLTRDGSKRSLLLARTGAGKSALLLHIERTKSNVSRIDPKDASFNFVSSSGIIKSLEALGVDLHIFYEYLWKHILCVHIITHCLGVRNGDKLRVFMNTIEKHIMRDGRKEAVYNYLKKWENNFFIDTDEISKEVVSEIQKKVAVNLGVEVGALEGKLEAIEGGSQREIKKLRQRAQTIVSNLQIRELNETITTLSELLQEKKATFYVLIDDLEKDWVSEELHYPLIRSLIDSLQTFGRMPNVRIIAALREDVYECVKLATSYRHFQAEKEKGLIVRLQWSDSDLMRFLELRINHLFENRYTTQAVSMSDLFPLKVREKSLFDFLIERTLRRPRDLIEFVNTIIEDAGNSNLPLGQARITGAENAYSSDRRQALVDEWRSRHPSLPLYLNVLLSTDDIRRVSDIKENTLSDLALEVASMSRSPCDDVEKQALKTYERNKEEQFEKLAKELVACLYKVGAIAVKLSGDQPYQYSYRSIALIEPKALALTSKITVTPMLRSTLAIRAQLVDAA